MISDEEVFEKKVQKFFLRWALYLMAIYTLGSGIEFFFWHDSEQAIFEVALAIACALIAIGISLENIES